MTTTKHIQIRKDQRGLVSFIVTLLLMIVISLIVLGFARITRREQRQALDRQLSTAAYYAAESGVNDARDHINKTLALPGGVSLLTEKNDCNQLGSYNQTLSPTVSYTCLLINPFPSSLGFKPVTKEASEIFPIAAQGGTVINSVTFYWQDSDGGTNLAGCRTSNIFPASWPANCDTGILRVDLVPVTSVDRATLTNEAMTAFLYPTNTNPAGTVNQGAIKGLAGQGGIVEGRCDGTGPQQCHATITGLTGTSYYARIKAVYDNSNVTVKANSLTVVGDLRLLGAQALVDATGKASDVVRRVQVNIPLVNSGAPPESVIDSVGPICKKFTISSTANSELPFKEACDLN